MGKTVRNGAIELLRFLFAIGVAIFHARGVFSLHLETGKWRFFGNGAVGVEFFLVLSGFFLAKNVYKKSQAGPSDDIGRETLSFFAKKYFFIFRYSSIFFITALLIEIIHRHYSLKSSIMLLIDGLPQLFMLDMTGIRFGFVNGYMWYLSAMLISMAVIYPLARKNTSLFIHIIAPLAAILVYGVIIANYGTIATISTWTGIVYKGLLRAFAGALLGCASFAVFEGLKEISFTLFGKIILSIFEIFLYVVAFVYINLRLPDTYFFYFAFLSAIAIPLTLSGFGLGGLIKGNAFFNFLGKTSLVIYLCQWSVHQAIIYFTNLKGNNALIAYIIAVLIVSTACTAIVDILQKKINLKRLFIK